MLGILILLICMWWTVASGEIMDDCEYAAMPIPQTRCGDLSICPQGRVLDKTETCNGYCYNDYHASEQIGYDLQFHCRDKCVPRLFWMSRQF